MKRDLCAFFGHVERVSARFQPTPDALERRPDDRHLQRLEFGRETLRLRLALQICPGTGAGFSCEPVERLLDIIVQIISDGGRSIIGESRMLASG
jgi:hypothetical protein